jgi:uncharacterized protein
MDAVMTVIGGGGLPAESREGGEQQPSRANSIFTLIVGLIILSLFITNPSLAFLLLASLSSGGHRRGGGGWGGGGGGFRGGGGRSGGGGASGSW